VRGFEGKTEERYRVGCLRKDGEQNGRTKTINGDESVAERRLGDFSLLATLHPKSV